MAALEDYDWESFGQGLEEVLKPLRIEALMRGRIDASRHLPIEVSWNQVDPNTLKAAEGLGQNIKGIADTVREKAQSILAQGMERGDSLQTIAKQLAVELGNDSENRAKLIARSETADAYSAGSMASYKEANVERKKWLASANSCDDCAGADGEVVGIDEPFSNGAMRPPLHPACTCAVAPVVGE